MQEEWRPWVDGSAGTRRKGDMCQEIIANERRCETLGDLREQVGAENVAFSEPELLPEAAFDDCNCLCHVDIDATAERSGITMYNADDWG